MLVNNDNRHKYVLFTPVGGNDPVGDEYYKDDMIKEINDKLKDDKDKSYKLIEYIESKRNKEPIFMEGAILHIVRHYKPECVVLLFTNTREEVDEKYDILKDNIEGLSKGCEIIKIEDFDKDYIYDWKHTIDNFNAKLESIPQKYKEHKILINITSSTPHINLKLCLEALNNDKLIPVQVLVSLDDLHTGEKNVQREVCKRYEEYEEIVRRCVEPDIHSIRKPKIKSQLHSLISVGDVDKNGKYNYHTAYNLLKYDKHIKKDLLNKIEEAMDRVNLNYKNDIEESKLKDMNRFREYYFVMKIKKIKGELSNFILRITPFITELFYYFLYSLNIEDLKNVFVQSGNDNYINILKIKNVQLQEKISKYILEVYINHKYKPKDPSLKDIIYLYSEIKSIDNIISNVYDKIRTLYSLSKSDKNISKDLSTVILNIYGNINNICFNKYKIINLLSNLINYKGEYAEIDDICGLYEKLKNKSEILYIADNYSKKVYATIQHLLIMFEFYNNNYLNIYRLFEDFRAIEHKVRHEVAHKLVNIDEDDIIRSVGLSSDMILDKCDELFRFIFADKLSENYIGDDGKLKFDYNCIINKDIEKLSKEPLEKYNEQ